MARPRVPDAERCDNRLSITLNEDDYFKLRRRARDKGIPPSVLARVYIRDGLGMADVGMDTVDQRPAA